MSLEEINECERDIMKTVTSWENEKDMLLKNLAILADEIKSQNEFMSKIDERSIRNNFMFDFERSISDLKGNTIKIENQEKEADPLWKTYKKQENHKQEGNRDLEDVLRTISQFTEAVDKSNEEVKALMLSFRSYESCVEDFYYLNTSSIEPTKENIELTLMLIGIGREYILVCERLMRSAEEICKNCEVKMDILEIQIQIDGFKQVKDECLNMMSQQKAKTRDYDFKWSNHVRNNKEHVQKLGKLKKWINSMPHDAVKLFKKVQDNAQDTITWTTKLSHINEKIDSCRKEANAINRKIKYVSKMADIESMTENPRIFALESMTPENITHIFSEIDKWNEMYESLKEAIGHWEDKMTEVEDNMRQWEIMVHEKGHNKLRDSSAQAGLSVV